MVGALVAETAAKAAVEEMRQLMALFGAFAILPVYLAVPFYETLQTTSFVNSYLDMVSAITTTGIDLFRDPERLTPALHLWRAEGAWLGGLLMWVAAGAILAPMSLGGFEVTARGEPGRIRQSACPVRPPAPAAAVRRRLSKK